MILVQIKRKENNISELTVTGHASAFYFEGNAFQKFVYFIFSSFFKKRISLLCCAVSAIFQTLELALDKENILISSQKKGGYLKLKVKDYVITETICELFLLGIRELQDNFPHELAIEEVYND